jgi:hypothetical protein
LAQFATRYDRTNRPSDQITKYFKTATFRDLHSSPISGNLQLSGANASPTWSTTDDLRQDQPCDVCNQGLKQTHEDCNQLSPKAV